MLLNKSSRDYTGPDHMRGVG